MVPSSSQKCACQYLCMSWFSFSLEVLISSLVVLALGAAVFQMDDTVVPLLGLALCLVCQQWRCVLHLELCRSTLDLSDSSVLWSAGGQAEGKRESGEAASLLLWDSICCLLPKTCTSGQMVESKEPCVSASDNLKVSGLRWDQRWD